MLRPSRTIDVSAKIEALQRRHADYEDRLRSFAKRQYLSAEEETEVRRLKRMKLFAKDEIHRFTSIGNA